MLGDRVSRLASENVVQARLCAALIPKAAKILEGLGDAPAAEGVYRNIELIPRGHLGALAVPLEDLFVDPVDDLDERDPKMKPRLSNGLTDRLPELGDDYLLGFLHAVGRVQDRYQDSGSKDQ